MGAEIKRGASLGPVGQQDAGGTGAFSFVLRNKFFFGIVCRWETKKETSCIQSTCSSFLCRCMCVLEIEKLKYIKAATTMVCGLAWLRRDHDHAISQLFLCMGAIGTFMTGPISGPQGAPPYR